MEKIYSADTLGAVNPITYAWSLINADGISFVGATNTKYVKISYENLTGVLRCVVTDATGCQRTIEFTLGSLPNPQPLVFNIDCSNLDIENFVGGPDVAILSGNQTGSLVINVDNSLSYTRVNQAYTDVFYYRFVDGNQHSATSTITINVAQCATPCSNSVLIDKLSYNEQLEVITFSLIITGLYDPADLQLTTSIGEITDLGDNDYSIAVEQSGTYIISATLDVNCDASDVAVLPVSLVPGPLLTQDNVYTNVDTPVTVYPLQNDSDPAGGSLSIESINGEEVNIGSQITLTEGVITVGNNSILFTPSDGWTGTVSIPYVAKSTVSGKESSSTMSITVQCFPPEITLVQFVAPSTNNNYMAIYDFNLNYPVGSTVVTTINGNDFTLSNHVEIPTIDLVIGENELSVSITSCMEATFSHSFTVDEIIY